jgi:hypothetical protein
MESFAYVQEQPWVPRAVIKGNLPEADLWPAGANSGEIRDQDAGVEQILSCLE